MSLHIRTEIIGSPDKMQVTLRLGELNPYPVVSVRWILSQCEVPLRFQEYPTYMVLKVFRSIRAIAMELISSDAPGDTCESLSSTEFLDGLDVFVKCNKSLVSLIVDSDERKFTTQLELDAVSRIVNLLDQEVARFLDVSAKEATDEKGTGVVSRNA